MPRSSRPRIVTSARCARLRSLPASQGRAAFPATALTGSIGSCRLSAAARNECVWRLAASVVLEEPAQHLLAERGALLDQERAQTPGGSC